MPKQMIARYKKENDFINQVLSDIVLEKEDFLLFNKELLVRLLTLKIFHPDKFKEILGGHSNTTYHYIDENLVLRIPKAHKLLYSKLSIEVKNLIQAHLLDLTSLKIVAYYSKYSLLVTELIPNYQSFSAVDFKNPSKLIALAHLVKKLHYSQFNFKRNTDTALSFIDDSSKYFQTVKPIFNKKDYKILKKLIGIKNFLKKSTYLKFPSHGDLHHYNIIETNGTMQLIDWELSSQEDPAYDISRLFCVTEFSYEQKQFFLSIYKNAYNIILSEQDIKKLIKRIILHESLNYFSIIIQSRYMMSFFSSAKQKFLIKTIQNFSVKDNLIRY